MARLAVTAAVVAVGFTVVERMALVPEWMLIAAAVVVVLAVTAPVWGPLVGLLGGVVALVVGLVSAVLGLVGGVLRLVTGGGRRGSRPATKASRPERKPQEGGDAERRKPRAARGDEASQDRRVPPVGSNPAEAAESWRVIAENHEARAATEVSGFRHDDAIKAARVAREREAAFRAEAERASA